MNAAARLLPPLRWARGYDRATFNGDLVAGVTVAVLVIPQGMAYAALAGLPPVVGLYAAVVPALVYALLGTSGQLSVGPVAIVALLTATAVGPLAEGDARSALEIAAVLALMVGAIHLALGALRLGVLANFLSHAVINGFTSAAAIVIAVSQVPDLLGVEADGVETLPQIVRAMGGMLDEANLATAVVGGMAIVALLAGKRFVPRLPIALVVVAASTFAAWALGLQDAGVDIVREVPAGLPGPLVPSVHWGLLRDLLPSAAVIALIGYAESMGLAKALAARVRQEVDPDQELLALGAANVAAGFFRGFPVAGSFSRSAVNQEAGARTPMAGAIAAAVTAVALIALTPLFYYLPRAALAATIVVAVLGLVDVRDAVRTARVRRVDGVAVLITFAGVLFLGIEPGLAGGVVFSLAAFIWRTSRPHTAELGRVEGTTTLRNVARYPTRTDPRCAILRFDGPLYFANARFAGDRILRLAVERRELEVIVLDFSAVTDLDGGAEHTLRTVDRDLAEAGVTLHLATVRGPVRDVLARSGWWDLLDGRVHASVADALAIVAPDTPLTAVEPEESPPSHLF